MRTYLRTLFNDIFKKNIFFAIITKIVNFYCNLTSPAAKTLKFQTNMSIKDIEKKRVFSFQSVTGDKIDCK